MTFVTDVDGKINKATQRVTIDDVTCYVDVNDTTVTMTYGTKEDSIDLSIMTTGAGNLAEIKGYPIISDTVTGGQATSDLDGTIRIYTHNLKIAYSYPTSTPNITRTTSTRTAKGVGTGHTDVPVVESIELTISKVSM